MPIIQAVQSINPTWIHHWSSCLWRADYLLSMESALKTTLPTLTAGNAKSVSTYLTHVHISFAHNRWTPKYNPLLVCSNKIPKGKTPRDTPTPSPYPVSHPQQAEAIGPLVAVFGNSCIALVMDWWAFILLASCPSTAQHNLWSIRHGGTRQWLLTSSFTHFFDIHYTQLRILRRRNGKQIWSFKSRVSFTFQLVLCKNLYIQSFYSLLVYIPV